MEIASQLINKQIESSKSPGQRPIKKPASHFQSAVFTDFLALLIAFARCCRHYRPPVVPHHLTYVYVLRLCKINRRRLLQALSRDWETLHAYHCTSQSLPAL